MRLALGLLAGLGQSWSEGLAAIERRSREPPSLQVSPGEDEMFDSNTGRASARRILDVRDVASEGCHTLLLDGDLDISSGAELNAIIGRLCEKGVERLTIDLSNLGFMDSTGLHAIISASELCAKHGNEFSVTAVPPRARRIFEVTGLAEQPWFQGGGVPAAPNEAVAGRQPRPSRAP
jgi:anti-sigma B factor antagonist